MTIGDVASKIGIKASAIRYYESTGLLPKPARISGKRQYDKSILDRLKIIEIAKSLDFSLGEIKILFEGISEKSPPNKVWRAFAEQKLSHVQQQITHAKLLHKILKTGLSCQCVRLSDCIPPGPIDIKNICK